MLKAAKPFFEVDHELIVRLVGNQTTNVSRRSGTPCLWHSAPEKHSHDSHGGEAEKEKSPGALGGRGGKDAYDWARKESGSEGRTKGSFSHAMMPDF